MPDPRWWTEGLPEDVIDEPDLIDGPPCMAVRRLMDWTFEALEKPQEPECQDTPDSTETMK